jgi:hypothetical protein
LHHIPFAAVVLCIGHRPPRPLAPVPVFLDQASLGLGHQVCRLVEPTHDIITRPNRRPACLKTRFI